MGPDFVFYCKPLPTAVCMERMDEDTIRQQLVEVLTVTNRNDCRVEVMLKDLQTVRHDLQHLRRWVELTRQVRDEVYGRNCL
jgi:hypothetical protein